MSDIFISYKQEERSIALQFAGALEKLGWSVWWDPKLQAGERFDDVIEAALKEARCVVVLWSKLSVNSQFVKDEATYALDEGKLTPIAIEPVTLSFRFRRLHTPQLYKWDGSETDPSFKELISNMETKLGPAPFGLEEQKRKRQEEPAAKRAESGREPLSVFRDRLKDGSEGPEMVVIPTGSFRMGDVQGDGDKDEKPVHDVEIENAFAMGLYPVTVNEFKKFVDAIGYQSEAERRENSFIYLIKRNDFQRSADTNWWRPGFAQQGTQPVVCVSWHDVVMYANWLGEQTGKRYRLPTEAEWEYACRAGTETRWYFGNDESELDDYTWYRENADGKTHEVGTKKPNPWGLHDMHGNVEEWVQDCWYDAYNGAVARHYSSARSHVLPA